MADAMSTPQAALTLIGNNPFGISYLPCVFCRLRLLRVGMSPHFVASKDTVFIGSIVSLLLRPDFFLMLIVALQFTSTTMFSIVLIVLPRPSPMLLSIA